MISEFGDRLANRDFEGAEALLTAALETAPGPAGAFVHLQFGRLYREWNKLTSAIDHLHRATEVAGVDVLMRMQIAEELKMLKHRQAGERP